MPEEPELIFGEPVQYMNFENVCDDTGVDFRLRFSFGKLVLLPLFLTAAAAAAAAAAMATAAAATAAASSSCALTHACWLPGL